MSTRVYGRSGTTVGDALLTCPEEHHTSCTEEYIADGSGNVAPTAIVTPASGNKVEIHVFQMNTSGASGEAKLDFVTSSKIVSRLYADKQNKVEAFQDHTEGVADEVLTFEADGIGAGKKVLVKVQYVEKR